MNAFKNCLMWLVIVSMATVSFAGTGESNLKDFDGAVTQSRLEMRKYCALVQELMKTADAEKQQSALSHLRQAAQLWTSVQAQYRDDPPAAYAADKQFASRLEHVSQQFAEMEAHLSAGRFKKSLQACGFACGLFVQMHEENGLVYALDRLFHLRKTVKTASAAAQNNGIAGVRELLPVMQQQRDRIFEAPCPAPNDAEKCRQYQDAAKTVSALIDELALDVANERSETAHEMMPRLLSAINGAYGLALESE